MRLAIRKLTYAPEEPAPQPSAEITKDFMMSPGSLRLEASLDKEVCVSPQEALSLALFPAIHDLISICPDSIPTRLLAVCSFLVRAAQLFS